MPDFDGILERVRVAVAETLSIEPEAAAPNQRFFADLGAESIDWLDLSFRIERDYKVRLPGLGSFDGIATDGEGRFTSSGMEDLCELMPGSLLNRLSGRVAPPTAKELADEITVADIAGMVVLALESKQGAHSS
jgi:acyl carrier protein